MTTVSAVRADRFRRAAARSVPAGPRRIAVAAAGALGLDELFDPVSTHVPLCPLHAWTGIWCPFCGGLRSAFELSRWHVATAWHDNALLVAGLPVVALWWLDSVIRERADRPRRRVSPVARVAVVAVLVLFTVVRNLPLAVGLRGGG